ncbi:MAG: peptide chain release factor 1 [Fibrobacterota bacterium]
MIEESRKVLEELRLAEEELSLPETVADPKRFRELGRRHARMAKIAALARDYLKLREDIEEWTSMLADPDYAAEARRELADIETRREPMEQELQLLMVPRDPVDEGGCLLEVRQGTGGDEAALFAGDLVRMYQRYCEINGLKVQILDVSEGSVGGFKEAVLQIDGEGAYGKLKYESGVHRVQRVPATEAQGRVHTSAATVVVLPEAEGDIEITINPADLRVDTYRAQGAGGQHVNKTESAIRITHIPSGLVAACQTQRSQMQNRETAMKMLQSKLYDKELQERQQKEASARKSSVGTGDRSAKIRTYNFPQNRLTDHRIGLTLYSLDRVMTGEIREILDGLALADSMEKLAAPEGMA